MQGELPISFTGRSILKFGLADKTYLFVLPKFLLPRMWTI